MYVNPFQISMDTLIGVSPMLGHRLENRSQIREAQEWSLLQNFQASSTMRLRNVDQKNLFSVAPLDILVSEETGAKKFHLIEINGTGIGGLTNITGDAVSAVLENFAELVPLFRDPETVILVAISGKEADSTPRLNKLMHEKVLYCEAFRRGFAGEGQEADVFSATQVLQDPQSFQTHRPAIVLGYIKDFVDHLELEADGSLTLAGRKVHAGVNDRFCLNVIQKFGTGVDLNQFWTVNRGFLAGADKGIAYGLLGEFLAQRSLQYFPRQVNYARVPDRDGLIATVLDWVRQGRKTVIKPQGTGLGHGIEFFLDRDENTEAIIARIDGSLKLTEEFYRMKGGALPYTVCEYIDTCTVPQVGHPLWEHKYEVRVIVYRDGMNLKAFPSITKIASEVYDARHPSHLSLINNITASAEATKSQGVEFMLPLCNRETMNLLGITQEQMTELCTFATSFMRFVLDKVQDEPARFGLPTTPARVLVEDADSILVA
jgi:hypothetical protein